jgi:uracil-DNA glycosylase
MRGVFPSSVRRRRSPHKRAHTKRTLRIAFHLGENSSGISFLDTTLRGATGCSGAPGGHFKCSPAERGKRRIRKKPRYDEIKACRPWLDAELAVVKPKILVCLGVTAAQSLLGQSFSVTRQRGQVVESPLAPLVMATVHPSSILRAHDSESRKTQIRAFVADLKRVALLAREKSAA